MKIKLKWFVLALILVTAGVAITKNDSFIKLTAKYLNVRSNATFKANTTLGNETSDVLQINGTILTNTTFTTANSAAYYFRNSLSATSGTHNVIRARAQSTAASGSTSDIRGVYAQAIANDGLFAGWVTGLYANPIAKGTSTSLGVRGILIDAETEGTPTAVGNLIGAHIRNKSTVAITTDNISLLIENEKMGTGIVQDAGIVLKTTTWGSGVTAWTYGIDMNQTGAFGTADIRLMNGETIDNTTDGIIDFGGELASVLTYSKDVGATTRDLLVDNAGLIGYQASSLKYKKNIKDLNAGFVDKIYNLRPVSFDWKASGVKGYGMIAEETAEVLPEVVSMDKDGFPETVNYHQMVPFLLKALQDQQARILELERNL